jgi:hypothetical protein
VVVGAAVLERSDHVARDLRVDEQAGREDDAAYSAHGGLREALTDRLARRAHEAWL